MIQLICTDKGQHKLRDIVEMMDRSRWLLADSTARWHVMFRSTWDRPRLSRKPERFWQPVLPLHPKYGGLELQRELIEAEVLVFRCPTCARQPRFRRDRLDDLCDRAHAASLTTLDLSRLE
jgi:hypothetical protein